jgi:sulfur carrier protein
MKIIVNGKEQQTGKSATLADIIRELGYEGDFFAVALNRVCVPRKNYGTTQIKEQDDIEILSPMQGG